MKNVLSVQSSVVYGYAGNKAAVLPMQLLGIDVWPFYTVQFSNHTQYGIWQGMAMPHGELSAIISGLDNLQKLEQCDAILSGYLGDQRHCEEVKLAITSIRQRNPQALYFCDPVMGDPQKGCIVAQGVESFFVDDAIQLADIMGPNLYELSVLTGKQLRSFEEVVEAAKQLVARGVKKVLVKHLGSCSRDKQSFEMLL
ncbi:pyridoxal kinase, partial [Escherichia coli]